MISARPVTAEIGIPPPRPLAEVMRSGTSPSCSQAKIVPVRPKPVWISSAMRTILFAVQNSRSFARNSFGRGKKSAFAQHRLDDHGRDLVRADLIVHEIFELLEALARNRRRIRARRPAISIRERRAVDFTRERAQAGFVRGLRRQRHRHVRAAVKSVIKSDDGLAARVRARDLDRVLDGFGAAVGEKGFLREIVREPRD